MIKQYKKKMVRFFDTLKSAFIEEVPEKNDTVLVSERKTEKKKKKKFMNSSIALQILQLLMMICLNIYVQ